MSVLLLAACTDTRETAAGQGFVRAIHAVPEFGAVSFLIEETQLDPLDYLDTSALREFDALEYDFNFDGIDGATGDLIRLARTTRSIGVDETVTFVLHGTPAAPEITTITIPERLFDAAETVLELAFAHFSRDAAAVDVYAGETGFDPATLAPLVTGLTPGTASDLVEIESGTYEIVMTAAGDPANILIRAEALGFSARDTQLVTLLDTAGELNGAHALSIGGVLVTGRLADDGAPSRVQLVHASPATGAIDVFLDDDLVNPIVAGLAPGTLSVPVDIPTADDLATFTLTVTEAGNPGTQLISSELAINDASTSLLFVTGRQADDSLRFVQVFNSRRPIFDATRLGVFNAIEDTTLIDFYLLEEDEVLAEERPRAANAPSSFNLAEVTLTPEPLDAYVTDSATDLPLVGPVPLDLQPGTVVQLVFIDTADPAVSDIAILSPLAP